MQAWCVNTTLQLAFPAQQASTPHLLAACHARLAPMDTYRRNLQQQCVLVSHHVWHVVPVNTLRMENVLHVLRGNTPLDRRTQLASLVPLAQQQTDQMRHITTTLMIVRDVLQDHTILRLVMVFL